MRHGIPGRANSAQQKEDVIERLLELWEHHPEMRLTQLIANVYRIETDSDRSKFYNTEDYPFITKLEGHYAGL